MNIQRENGIDEVNCAFRMLNIHKEDVYTIIQLCKKFDIKKGNIYCSIISSYDNGGFRLPSYIIYLIKEMQEIELDFSFVVC